MSIGNKCDIDESDIFEYMINDSETKSSPAILKSLVEWKKIYQPPQKKQKKDRLLILMEAEAWKEAKAARAIQRGLIGNNYK